MVPKPLEKTSEAIRDISAHTDRYYGVHQYPEQRIGVDGLDVGSIDFDASRHGVHLMDPLSPMEPVYGVQQVRMQLPQKPLIATIVGDLRTSDTDSRIDKSKKTAIKSIAQALEKSMPAFDFVASLEMLGDTTGDADRQKAQEEKSIYDEITSGLGFVISDFSRMDLTREFPRNTDVLAIKVNHPIELAVTAGVGRLSLGGMIEIDTDRGRELAEYNSKLAEYHASIVDRITRSGATVVQLVTDHRNEARFDPEVVDNALALSISNISK